MKSVGKDVDKKEKELNLREKRKKVTENLRDTRKVVTLHPLFGVTAVVWAEVLSKSMLRWNDKQFLILYKKWI